MHRVVNYGSFMQAYGLKKTLESMGHEVQFVDYHVEPCRVGEAAAAHPAPSGKDMLKLLVRKVFHFVFPGRKKRLESNVAKAFDDFGRIYSESIEKYLGVTPEFNRLPELDALIIGSDEVFNCMNTDPQVGYSLELFGKDNRAKVLISYAACFGNTTYEKIANSGAADEIASLLRNFNAISVRDRNSGGIIKKLLGAEPSYNLDPALIYSFDAELAQIPPPNLKDYIIVYGYTFRISRGEAASIRNFASKHNKKVIAISGYQHVGEPVVCSPFEALNYFKYADFVFTDTFHGTVFSIKYNRPFAVFVRDSSVHGYGNAEKVMDLLERFSLTSRAVRDLSDLESIAAAAIDFSDSNEFLEAERQRAREYLLASLNN